MKLSFKYVVPRKARREKAIIEDLMWHTSKVYNTLLYELKEKQEIVNYSGSINVQSSKIYKRYRQDNWHSEYLHSHSLQQVIINVLSNMKSYTRLKEEYEKGNEEIKGKPRIPRFKGNNEQEVVITKYGIRVEGKVLKLSISKKMQEKHKVKSLNFLIPSKLKKLICFESIKMIKIQKSNNEIVLNIIYEKEAKTDVVGNNIMAIDIGLNNIVACTNRDNNSSMIISGRALKSKNIYYNEKISYLQSIITKMKKGKYKVTNQIKQLYKKRNNYMYTYIHKVSREVIEYAKTNKCGTIVIGDIKDIKQKMKGNKTFVQVPVQSILQKIEYKAMLENIEVKLIKENYTSGVSALDKEDVVKENYNKKRRICRGLFVTNKGKKINADINGSLNILSKYIKENSPNQEIAMDNGREQRPIKKRVA